MEYDLSRFLQAQQMDYAQALTEIRNGRKISHWIWYIFPQMKGLGHSSMSEHFGIRDLGEAKAYLANPVLGGRLVEISNALLALDSDDAAAVMGRPDDMKLKSSMTLFEAACEKMAAEKAASEDLNVFQKVLEKFYGGKRDRRTLRMLGLEETAH